jgi:pyruvate dehydrogenase E1 component alpha subunit
MSELFGRIDGCARGKGGSMHMFDKSLNFLGGHGIVGANVPLATGVGFAIKYRGGDQVCICFMGESVVNTGAFHEALNMAGLWKLPVVYVIENNRYGMGTALERASAIYDVAQRACSYDMPAEVVDGMDVLAVRDAVARAAQRARDRYMPTLLEIRTYRFMGHSMSDPIHGHYRSKDEVEEMKARDPIHTFADKLRAEGLLDDEHWQAMEAGVNDEVQDALRFADESPEPDAEALTRDVYKA